MIHPTAVVDPIAEIESDVAVGPHTLVEGVVLIASGTEIRGQAVITGSVQIGKNNRIGYDASSVRSRRISASIRRQIPGLR